MAAKQGIYVPKEASLLSIPGQIVHYGALGYSLVPPHTKPERFAIIGQAALGSLVRKKKDRPSAPPKMWDGDTYKSKKDPNRSRAITPIEPYSRGDVLRDPTLVQKDYVYLVDFEVNPTGNILNPADKNYSYVRLDFVPSEVEVTPEPNYATIASLGRNNPFYHFTGGEKTIEFDIDWFSLSDNSREDVITRCQWLEALSFANGYIGPPHRIKVVWTKQDKLFADTTWIIKSAPYKLKEFVQGYSRKGSDLRDYQAIGLMPQSAIQHVTLARVTDHNLNHSEMMYYKRGSSLHTSGMDRMGNIDYEPQREIKLLPNYGITSQPTEISHDFVIGNSEEINYWED